MLTTELRKFFHCTFFIKKIIIITIIITVLPTLYRLIYHSISTNLYIETNY